MRKEFFLLIIWCSMVWASSAAESTPARRVINIYKDVFYHTDISRTALENTPPWTLVTENPPLPVGKAMGKARLYVIKRFAEAKDWNLDVVHLEQPTSAEDRWIYIVYFDPTPKTINVGKRWRSFGVVVLMNGEVLEIQEIKKGD